MDQKIVKLEIVYGPERTTIVFKRDHDLTVIDIMQDIEKTLKIPVDEQVLHFKGLNLCLYKNDKLETLGVANNNQIRLSRVQNNSNRQQKLPVQQTHYQHQFQAPQQSQNPTTLNPQQQQEQPSALFIDEGSNISRDHGANVHIANQMKSFRLSPINPPPFPHPPQKLQQHFADDELRVVRSTSPAKHYEQEPLSTYRKSPNPNQSQQYSSKPVFIVDDSFANTSIRQNMHNTPDSLSGGTQQSPFFNEPAPREFIKLNVTYGAQREYLIVHGSKPLTLRHLKNELVYLFNIPYDKLCLTFRGHHLHEYLDLTPLDSFGLDNNSQLNVWSLSDESSKNAYNDYYNHYTLKEPDVTPRIKKNLTSTW
jgi:hypothetical protein